MSETTEQPVLGIDIGRVIIAPGQPDGAEDTSFFASEEAAMATPAVPGAFEAIRRLVKRYEGRVYLVSKAGPQTQGKTVRWLKEHRFWTETGVDPQNLRFCLERPQKAEHCRDNGIDHFIDDRLDVLEHLQGLCVRLLWFAGDEAQAPDWCEAAPTWAAVLDKLSA